MTQNNHQENTLSYLFTEYLNERVKDGSIAEQDRENYLLHFVQFFDGIKAHVIESIDHKSKDQFFDTAYILLLSMFSNDTVNTDKFIKFIDTFSPSKIISTYEKTFDLTYDNNNEFIPLLVHKPKNEEDLSNMLAAIAKQFHNDIINNK